METFLISLVAKGKFYSPSLFLPPSFSYHLVFSRNTSLRFCTAFKERERDRGEVVIADAELHVSRCTWMTSRVCAHDDSRSSPRKSWKLVRYMRDPAESRGLADCAARLPVAPASFDCANARLLHTRAWWNPLRDVSRSASFEVFNQLFFLSLFSNSFECVYSRLEPRESIIIGRENRILAWEEGGIESFAIGGGEGGNWESREGCGGEGEFFFSLVNNEFRGNSFCFFLVFGTGELEREEFLFPVQGW